MENKKQICLLVSGVVQGVGFRSFTKRIAKKLGILGQVKNLSNGKVEIIAQGGEHLLDEFLKEIKKSSPGKIERISLEKIEEMSNFNDFQVVF